MTQPNQSELEEHVEQMVARWFGEPVLAVEDELVSYITANYTPNSEVQKILNLITNSRVDSVRVAMYGKTTEND